MIFTCANSESQDYYETTVPNKPATQGGAYMQDTCCNKGLIDEVYIKVVEEFDMETFQSDLAEKYKDSLSSILAYKRYYEDTIKETGTRPSKYEDPSDLIKIHDIYNSTPIEGYRNPNSNGKIAYYFRGCAYVNYITDAAFREMEFFSKMMSMDVITSHFRVAPEVTFHEMLEDTLNGYLYILELGYHPKDIMFFGDSSGAGTAIATALKIRDKDLPMPALLALQTPWLNVTMDSASYTQKKEVDCMLGKSGLLEYAHEVYLDKTDKYNPYVSTCYADLKSFPPIITQIASNDITYDDSILLMRQARKANVTFRLEVYEDMFHEFMCFRELAAAQHAWLNLGTFIKEHVNQ